MTDRPDPGWLRLLWQWLRPYRRQVVLSLLLAIVGQGLLALVPLVQQIIIDDVLGTGAARLAGWIGVLCGIGVITFVSHAVRRYLGSRVAVDVQHDLRVAVHRHLHTLDARRHQELAAGDVLSRSTADLNLIQMFISQVPLFLANVTLLVVGLIVMAALSPLLFVVVALSVPVLAYVTLRLRHDLYPASFSDQVQLGQVASAVEEEIGGVRLVRAFARESHQRRRFIDRAATLFSSRIRTARISARWGAAMAAIPAFTQLGVLIFGGWLALANQISLGVFLAFASYVLQFAAPTRLLAAMVSTTQLARSGARRVFMLLDTTSTLTTGSGDLPDPHGVIEVDDADLTIDGRPVLAQVSTRIEPGRRVAVVGPSGSGKTMLALLIGRFYDPDRGRVRIGGTDLRDVSLESVRAAVTMVFDDSLLFSGTVRDNITLGRPGATEAEVHRAAEAAAAHEFISGLPNGYDTETGPHGIALSGGQRQRIALARAFLVDPAILILDDATSAVDSRTELAILDSLQQLMSGRTTILIAHRPTTVELADHVIVMENGRMTHDGRPDIVAADSEFVRDLLVKAGERRNDTAVVSPVDVADPTPCCWPDPAELPGHDDPELLHHIGLTAESSGDQAARVDPGLRRAILKLPSLSARPASTDDPRTAALSDPRPFAIRGTLRPFLPAIALCAALVLIDAGTTLAAPMAFRFGIDNGISAAAPNVFWLTCIGLGIVAVVSWVNSRLLLFKAARVSERVLYSLRTRLFDHLQRLPVDHFDRHAAGQIITRLTTDVDAVNQLLQQGLVNSIVSISTCAGVLVVLLALDWRLALAMLTLLPVLAVASWIFIRGSHAAYLQARTRISTVTATLAEHLGRIRVTQSFSAEAAASADFAKHSTSYRDSRRRTMLYISVFFPFMNLLAIGAKALVLVVGAQLLEADTLTIGVLVATLLYVDQFFTPLQQLSIVLDLWIQAKVATGRMTEFLATPVETISEKPTEPSASDDGDLTFEDVTFGYRGTPAPAVDRVDLTIPHGHTVALVGSTGAGKTTLAKLVLRFYEPDSGALRLGGRRIDELDVGEYRRRIGYVPQDPYLFTGTIASNIAFGRPGAGPSVIENAARAVGAHDMIASLPFGYRTTVGPGRSTLSAGQQQLVCLARAELVGPELLVLDEATANIDLATERRVQAALDAVSRRRTTVLVAHRLATAARADLIVVMSGGRIVERGGHDALIDGGGVYAALWQGFSASKSDNLADVNLST
ncbi:ABC transporter ATP-binding protein [Gordonia rubripertincta]|uniref:ABC transporter ATP-binding protein n=1 Tax=Gordonia rubripertincta TaxID=36822 RepID=A0ABT4N0C1_GORRU|nr:ABC transporter ATP-binding protein [Gordonia rubripertincta]MCZ4551741.1 ABC transporter ATP-binding protein [Gordonia rubripertincta]